MQLDAIDDDIIWRLAENGRLSIAQLAAAVGIASSTCHARVKALCDNGVIRAFHALVDLDAIGLPFQALIMVRARPQQKHELDAFAERIVRLPQIINLFSMASVDNFVVHVACTSRTQLRDFVSKYIHSEPTVISTQTNLIYDQYPGSEYMSHLRGLDEMRRDIP